MRRTRTYTYPRAFAGWRPTPPAEYAGKGITNADESRDYEGTRPARGQWVDFQDIPSGCSCRWDTPLRTGVGRVTGGNGLNGTWEYQRPDAHCPRHGGR